MSYTWDDIPSALNSLNFEANFRAALEGWKDNLEDMETRIPDGDYRELVYSKTVYKRNTVPTGGASTDAASRRSFVLPSWMLIGINEVFYSVGASQTLDLNTSANWNSSETTYATAANRAGKDVYVYACEPSSGTTPDIVFSCDSSYPDDYTAASSRKIGGFHCLCAAVGTIAGHELTGYLQGDILPNSVWDLLYRAQSENEGMVWSEKAGIWVDIYLASGTGASTASVNGGTISDNRNWMDVVDDFAAVKKRMLDDDEFTTIAAGSNEETNITGSADPVTTGGHSDTASQRMISDIGCEDCCGAVYQWLRTQTYQGNLDGGGAFDEAYTWKDQTDGQGELATQGDYGDAKLLAGGYWNAGVKCGSRSRNMNSYRWVTYGFAGARGCAEPRVVNLD